MNFNSMLHYINIAILSSVAIILILLIRQAKINKDKRELENLLTEKGYFKILNESLMELFGNTDLSVSYKASLQILSYFEGDRLLFYLRKYFNFTRDYDIAISNLKKIKEAQVIRRNAVSSKKRFYKHSDAFIPVRKMEYTSPMGRSSDTKEFIFTEYNCDVLISYLIKEKGNVSFAIQERKKMTAALRERILERDNYTCQVCGNSIFEEPNLLLEVDHIIPISKGGKTEEDNLRTLCWRCNRSKSNK